MERVRKLLSIDDIHNQGITGKDVGICVLDTGVSPHPDLVKQIVFFYDLVHHRKYLYDDNGHGTHVAGILASNGISSNGKYCGIVPDANLIILKCLDNKGKGRTKHALQAFEFIKKNREKYNIRIVNISIGAEYHKDDKECQDLLEAVEELWRMGLVVVAAAGNNGPMEKSITLPGCAKSIITVGAFDDFGDYHRYGIRNQNYSGRGPTKNCVVKPEIVAPGTGIISCAAVKNHKNTTLYTAQSGTSMATPVVSGAVGLLLDKNPTLSNKDVKKWIFKTAKDLGLSKSHQGWGLIQPKALLGKELWK